MPLIRESDYTVPFYLTNPHLQTIYPSLLRKVYGVEYTRERFHLADGDFIDLDFSKIGSEKLVIVLHGLEGNADRPYIRGMVRIFNENGWDGMGVNFRGCSGESNLKPQTYHSGETGDLGQVIDKLSAEGKYSSIVIVGFSLGGNVTLKYIGENGDNLNPLIKAAVAFSVPIHLETASVELAKWQNSIYMNRFMSNLKEKIKNREVILREIVDLPTVYKAKSFLDFDESYTAPVFGFENALDYWTKASSKQFIPQFSVPVLLVNAKDDSFLSKECYPKDEASSFDNFFLEIPNKGGHVGFIGGDEKGYYWSEHRAWRFIQELGI